MESDPPNYDQATRNLPDSFLGLSQWFSENERKFGDDTAIHINLYNDITMIIEIWWDFTGVWDWKYAMAAEYLV